MKYQSEGKKYRSGHLVSFICGLNWPARLVDSGSFLGLQRSIFLLIKIDLNVFVIMHETVSRCGLSEITANKIPMISGTKAVEGPEHGSLGFSPQFSEEKRPPTIGGYLSIFNHLCERIPFDSLQFNKVKSTQQYKEIMDLTLQKNKFFDLL